MNVTPFSSQLAILAALKTTALDGGKMCLYQNDITPNAATELTDLTPADFGGYIQQPTATWGAPFIDVGGECTILGPLVTFTCSGVAPSNQCYGAYFVNATGALVFAFRFENAPISMDIATDVIAIVPRYQTQIG